MQIRLIFVLLLISSFGWSQNNASSPYTSQGLGETTFFGSSIYQSLGGSSVSLIDSTQSNIYNPSSYAFLAQGLPQFSLGVNYRNSTFSQNNATAKQSFGNITHFSLIVPFAKRFGLGFGLKPLSRIGYEINNSEVLNSDSIFYDYKGTGGIQQLFAGFSVKLINERKHKLGLGVNGDYLFGFSEKSRRVYQVVGTNEVGGIIQNETGYRGFAFDLGFNYTYKPTTEHLITVGGTYRPELDLKSDRTEFAIYHTNFFTTASYDTLTTSSDSNGSFTLPSQMKVGLTYEYIPQDDTTKNRVNKPSFLFTLETETTEWSKLQNTFNSTSINANLSNSSSLRFGFQYTPHRFATDRSTFIKYYSKMSYRAGYYSSQLAFNANGEQLEEFGISFGLGLPIVVGRAVSSVNIGANFGQRGNSNANTISENFWGINFGVHLSPGYDRWFKKYKYD